MISVLFPSIVDLGYSTRRNSSALELLAYLATGMIRSEIPLYFHSYWLMLGILLLMLILTASLLWSPAWWAVKTIYHLERETPTFSSSEIACTYVYFRSSSPFLRIWDHKLVSNVPAPPNFRQCLLSFGDSGYNYVYLNKKIYL